MLGQIMKNIIISVLISIAFFLIGYFFAFPLSSYLNMSLRDTFFIEGITVVVTALFFSIQRDSSGVSIRGLGDRNALSNAYHSVETTRVEREFAGNNKSLKNHSMSKLTFSTLSLVFAGIFILLYSVFGI